MGKFFWTKSHWSWNKCWFWNFWKSGGVNGLDKCVFDSPQFLFAFPVSVCAYGHRASLFSQCPVQSSLEWLTASLDNVNSGSHDVRLMKLRLKTETEAEAERIHEQIWFYLISWGRGGGVPKSKLFRMVWNTFCFWNFWNLNNFVSCHNQPRNGTLWHHSDQINRSAHKAEWQNRVSSDNN